MKTTTATLALLVLAACAAPPRLQPALRGDAPLALQGAALPAAAWPASRWWQRYDDPVLAGLVERALAGAPRIAAASARLATAREQVRLAGAAQGAQVQLNAQFDRLRLSENGLLPTEFLGFSWYNQADLGLAVSYQLDWWGTATGEPGCRAGSRPRCHGRAAGRRGGAVGGSGHRIFRMAGRCGAH